MSRPDIFFRHLLSLLVLTALLSLVGCNLAGPPPTPGGIAGGPNLTLTALFSSVGQPDQTETPGVILPASPTSTQASLPPTEAVLPSPQPSPESSPMPTQAPTQVPTQVPTVQARSGAVARAVFLAVPPIINGNFSDFGGEIYLINHVVYGASNHGGDADASGRFLVSWDNQYLYVAVEAWDDVYAQNTTGNQIYKGDVIEVLLDAALLNDFQSTELNDDDYQLGLSPGRGQPGANMENWLWFPRGKSAAVPGVVLAAQRIDGGYVLEAAIPWSTFGITPSAGQRYGFSVAISDNDDTAAPAQQSMTAFAPNRQLTNPTTWLTLELVMP